jgi:hypothetical protein
MASLIAKFPKLLFALSGQMLLAANLILLWQFFVHLVYSSCRSFLFECPSEHRHLLLAKSAMYRYLPPLRVPLVLAVAGGVVVEGYTLGS